MQPGRAPLLLFGVLLSSHNPFPPPPPPPPPLICLSNPRFWGQRDQDRPPMSNPQCCSNPPTLNPTSGDGAVVGDLGGLKAYTSGDAANTKLALVLVSDIYGFEAPILRGIADKLAAAGYFVVVPDYLYGDPFDHDNADTRPFRIWIKKHLPADGSRDVKKVVQELKARGMSSVGAAGFCMGAKVVVELAKSCDIQSAVLLHPSLVTSEDIKDVKTPTCVLAAETDYISTVELINQFEEILRGKPEVPSMVKVFKGVSHGWSCRYEANDDYAIKKAYESHYDMLSWFAKTLMTSML